MTVLRMSKKNKKREAQHETKSQRSSVKVVGPDSCRMGTLWLDEQRVMSRK